MFTLFVFIVVLLLACTIFEIPLYAVILAFVGLVVLAVAIYRLHDKYESSVLDRIVRARLVEEVPVFKETVEKKGFSVGYKMDSYRSHYEYVKVLDHYECCFKVFYEDGKHGMYYCRKDSQCYNELMSKIKY